MPDKYELNTQYIPALLCSLPFILVVMYFISKIDASFWGAVLTQTAGGIGISGAIYYLASYTCRHVGKWLEDAMFNNGESFPTTTYLLDYDTHFSNEHKQEIRSKIFNNFNIDLKDRTRNTHASRQRIHEAVGRIRQQFFKANDMILMRNIQFGFSKNLAGGSLVALVVSVALLTISLTAQTQLSSNMCVILIFWYVALSIYGLIAMRSNAKRYALALFDEFLAK